MNLNRVKKLALLAMTASAVSCGDIVCANQPCPLPIAVIVNVSSTTSGKQVPGAYVKVNGSSNPQLCTQGTTTVCTILGAPGDYKVEVGAPGLVAIISTVTFEASRGSQCGCASGAPVTLDIALFTPPPPA
jgi:hypothetical protein